MEELEELKSWLTDSRLVEYYDEMVQQGYESVKDIDGLDENGIEELMQHCGIKKPGHKSRFKSACVARKSTQKNPPVEIESAAKRSSEVTCKFILHRQWSKQNRWGLLNMG